MPFPEIIGSATKMLLCLPKTANRPSVRADGINFHGGHHNILIEQCEMSYTGDDPYGLWPVSEDAQANPISCQTNIVLRNNTGRWPRQHADMNTVLSC